MRPRRAVRFGSYSIAATLPGMPSLSRLKSIIRRFWREPPPRWRVVMTPRLLRPACFCFGARSERHDGLLPVAAVGLPPAAPAAAARLALHDHHVDTRDRNVEGLLHGVF